MCPEGVEEGYPRDEDGLNGNEGMAIFEGLMEALMCLADVSRSTEANMVVRIGDRE